MYTIQKIIDNQKMFKDDIYVFLNKEQKDAKIILNSIKSDDKYIIKQKNKLKNRFKKIKAKNYIQSLFFLSSARSDTFYVWWDVSEQEAKILKYDKK